MTYPNFDFSDSNLNYQLVENTVYDMMSDLNNQQACCMNIWTKEAFDEARRFTGVFAYDKANAQPRYKADCKAAYLILYPVANG